MGERKENAEERKKKMEARGELIYVHVHVPTCVYKRFMWLSDGGGVSFGNFGSMITSQVGSYLLLLLVVEQDSMI